MMSAAALVDHVEHNTNLDVIAITDHDEIEAALVARDRAAAAGYRVEVIPGVEVTTREGHLLALFVEERPTALRSALETAEWVIAHGGVCVAPHPFSRWTHSLGERTLNGLAGRGLLGCIEVLNASPAGRVAGSRAQGFARDHGLAAIGGSDAHMLRMVGLARTRFAGRDACELRLAIVHARTVAEGRFARADEVAADALPQLARSLVHLPLRRLARALRGTS
jgi:predicted metal-dependent phosphoesterase TrpH